MSYHITAFLLGVILDLIVGDPYKLPHPVRYIGSLISFLEKRLLDPVIDSGRDSGKERKRGVILCVLVVTTTLVMSLVIITAAYMIHPYAGLAVETVLTCYVLAARSLETECMKVYRCLKNGTTEEARRAVSMVVGRDTNVLDNTGIAKAAVETVAENTSDGVIAPLIYTFAGGPVLGLVYKAINTLDSMVGYRNDRYEYFGTASARLDDAVNYIPARISAALMILAAFLLGRNYSGTDACRIFKRDRYNHKSPNSAQTESVCAGALKIQLAGDAVYFGKTVKKPFIGDDIRPVEPEDIPRTCKLMYMTEFLAVLVCIAIYAVIKII